MLVSRALTAPVLRAPVALSRTKIGLRASRVLLAGLAIVECAANVLRALSRQRIVRRTRIVRLAMLGLEACVRSVHLALSLTRSVRAVSGATLGLRAVMVPAAPVLMDRRSTT